jgi:deoxyribose-phosphate aldolase
MKEYSSINVKAAGGIRTLDSALQMINAGASRLGTSAGVSIVNELRGLKKSEVIGINDTY